MIALQAETSRRGEMQDVGPQVFADETVVEIEEGLVRE